MKILFLEWDSFAHEYIVEEFRKSDCKIDMFFWSSGCENMRNNEALSQKLQMALNAQEYDFVFSLNFFPVVSKICNECEVKYVSWIIDSSYLLLYSQYTMLDTNYIYFFDKSLYYEFKRKGVMHAFYLPVAAPVETYDKMGKSEGKIKKYQSEISFVGSTYNEEQQNLYKLLLNVDDYTAGYLNAIMEMQKEIYGKFLLEELLTDHVLRELKRVCPMQKEKDDWATDAKIYANYFLARKMTGEQRKELLYLLSEKYQVKLYTTEQTPELQFVQNCGPVDYVNQMPYVFKGSCINLNMTLRSIHTGIPLRAMDIMGCGGFLLTNYQEDFLEYFEPGVDYVFYSSKEEMLALVEYYLKHEEERCEIANNGYQKVKARHTYRDRVQLILLQMKELQGNI